jgi:hypothetical protein
MSSIVPPPPPHANSFVKGTAVINTVPTDSGPGPAPPWVGVGSRSPDGWDQIPRWAGGWVLHQSPWSFGFDSQTRGTRENRAPPCVKAPGSSRVPPRPGWAPDPLMVTFLKVYMELGSYFLFLQEQIKDIIIIMGSDPPMG